ncbi:MAG: hypothetical protein ACFB0C_02375 [Leptolyngbyaceae cyanobacterium]
MSALLAGSLSLTAQSPESKCKIPKPLCLEPKQQKIFVQFVIQSNTSETALATEDLLHLVSKRVRPKHFVEISQLSGTNTVRVLYSATATKRTIQDMHWQIDSNPNTAELDLTPSAESALVDGIQRFRDRVKSLPSGQELHFYLVTEGTSNPDILSKLHAITSSIASEDLSQTHIYVIGVSEHRLEFSSAFNPIENNVYFASTIDSEWMPLVRKF